MELSDYLFYLLNGMVFAGLFGFLAGLILKGRFKK
jgi:hypothetical protein